MNIVSLTPNGNLFIDSDEVDEKVIVYFGFDAYIVLSLLNKKESSI